jgi:drug/metabolite transporter superfamily protein YnfA
MLLMTWMFPIIVGGFPALAGAVLIRKWRGVGGRLFMIAGILVLGSSGIIVNAIPWSFSRLMCAYIAAFTLISFWWRQFVIEQKSPKMVWLGVAIVATSLCRSILTLVLARRLHNPPVAIWR